MSGLSWAHFKAQGTAVLAWPPFAHITGRRTQLCCTLPGERSVLARTFPQAMRSGMAPVTSFFHLIKSDSLDTGEW